jgi:hypothetical protein
MTKDTNDSFSSVFPVDIRNAKIFRRSLSLGSEKLSGKLIDLFLFDKAMMSFVTGGVVLVPLFSSYEGRF